MWKPVLAALLVAPAAVATDPRPLVWVADGAGDFRGSSDSLREANALFGNPVEVVPFVWSHGYRKVRLDQTDHAWSRCQGRRMAAAVLDRQRQEPGRRVIVLGNSTGTAVALAAAEALPAGAIDRLILIAPAVSTGYDPRPAARAAQEGTDVFVSRRDVFVLGVLTRAVGTADGRRGRTAGRFGFEAAGCGPAVRHHFWTREWERQTGHDGGHFGSYEPEFIRQRLFPLMVGPG